MTADSPASPVGTAFPQAKPVEIGCIRFDGQREARRYQYLKILQRIGDISELELQPLFLLECGDVPVRYDSGCQAKYIADFRYRNKEGEVIVEDLKGMDTPQSKLKRAMVKSQYCIEVNVNK